MANSIFPRMMRGRKARFMASLPWRISVLPTIPTRLPGWGAPWRDSASVSRKS